MKDNKQSQLDEVIYRVYKPDSSEVNFDPIFNETRKHWEIIRNKFRIKPETIKIIQDSLKRTEERMGNNFKVQEK